MKFRFWYENKLHYFTLNQIMVTTLKMMENAPVQQYTGLKDKNGKEIYEGDIVKELYHKPIVNSVFQHIDGSWITDDKCPWKPLSELISWPGVETIGNIYENPELLENRDEND